MPLGNISWIRICFILFALLGASLLTGCSTAPDYHDVGFDGSITVENGSFKMEGAVDVGSGAQPEATFENVTIALYTIDRNRIKEIRVGTLSTVASSGPMEQRVNFSTNTVPKYVVIQSKDFWSRELNIQVVSYVLRGNSYEKYFRYNRNQKFPSKDSYNNQ